MRIEGVHIEALDDFFSDNVLNLPHENFVLPKADVNHRRQKATIPGGQSHFNTSLVIQKVGRIFSFSGTSICRRKFVVFHELWGPGRKPTHGNLIEEILIQRSGVNAIQLVQFIPLQGIGRKSTISERRERITSYIPNVSY